MSKNSASDWKAVAQEWNIHTMMDGIMKRSHLDINRPYNPQESPSIKLVESD